MFIRNRLRGANYKLITKLANLRLQQPLHEVS
nr:MAG TPA: hypothetical protein [Caudoviricetes sp.]